MDLVFNVLLFTYPSVKPIVEWINICSLVAMLPAETFIIKAIGNDKIIQQDDTNSSSMLEMNGKQSSSKHTRYINIILRSTTTNVILKHRN